MIEQSLKQGKNRSEIAKILGFHRSSIGREIRRNKAVKADYNAAGAHGKAISAKQQRHEYRRKIEGPLQELVEQLLEDLLSPQQISERLRVEQSKWQVSHETIYKWIYYIAPDYRECLRWRSRRRQKRVKRLRRSVFKAPKKLIDARPEKANQRAERGHWERDLLEGRRGGPSLLVVQDRKTRWTILRKVLSHHSDEVNQATAAVLSDQKVLSITNDNGVEFGVADCLENMIKSPVYYCHPNSSWERGSVENVNGLIRQYFPKRTDFSQVSQADIERVQNAINARPKKVLGYRSPTEIHEGKALKVVMSETYYRRHSAIRNYKLFKQDMIKELGFFIE